MKLLTAAFVAVLCTRGYAATVIDEPMSNVGSEQMSVIPLPTALSDSETTVDNSNISLVSLSVDIASETASSQPDDTSIGSLIGTNDDTQGLLTQSDTESVIGIKSDITSSVPTIASSRVTESASLNTQSSTSISSVEIPTLTLDQSSVGDSSSKPFSTQVSTSEDIPTMSSMPEDDSTKSFTSEDISTTPSASEDNSTNDSTEGTPSENNSTEDPTSNDSTSNHSPTDQPTDGTSSSHIPSSEPSSKPSSEHTKVSTTTPSTTPTPTTTSHPMPTSRTKHTVVEMITTFVDGSISVEKTTRTLDGTDATNDGGSDAYTSTYTVDGDTVIVTGTFSARDNSSMALSLNQLSTSALAYFAIAVCAVLWLL